jgi:sterol desaturase/sphingolipid hydroxylase (fatty acid hydroxylase superfamily)
MFLIEQLWAGIAWIANAIAGEQGFVIQLVVYVSMILFERACYLFQHRHEWPERESLANVLNNSVTAILEAVLAAVVGGALFIMAYQFIHTELRLFTIPALWWGWVLALLMNDLTYYLDHRIAHRTGLFWATHIPHHSSQEMNLTVSARGSITALGGFLQPSYYLLPLLGLSLPMFIAARFFGNLWGIFNHTRLVHRMGWLENWLATPANHRVHHGTQPKYLDRNYGQTLIIWDRLFGTFQKEEEEPVYGLVRQMNSHRIWDIQTWGIRWLWAQINSAPRLQDKLRYLWNPPGWRHDGNHERSEEIRDRASAA